MKRVIRIVLAALAVSLSMGGVAANCEAHTIDQAFLSLEEVSPGRFQYRFQTASQVLADIPEPASFPAPCRLKGSFLECGESGLVGTIAFPWLEGSLTRLVVSIEWHDGSKLLRLVTGSSPELTVYGIPATGIAALWPVLFDYGKLGVEHILGGFDHLFFVIALAFLVRRPAQLVATITAFTLAHSLTLAASALGIVALPTAPVEAMIALSIVLICVECLRPEASLTRRAPWLVAFSFGLLHGLGFASALLDIGLPERHLPSALFGFNVGVECGQLLVIGVFLGLRWLSTRLAWQPRWVPRTLVYAMGSVAAYWSIERVVLVLWG